MPCESFFFRKQGIDPTMRITIWMSRKFSEFVSNPCIDRGGLSNKACKLFTNCLNPTRISMHILKSQGILDQLSLPSVVENEGATILVGLF